MNLRLIIPFSQIWLTMKVSFFLLFTAIFQLYAHSSYSQETKMSVEASSIQLRQLFSDIEKQSEFLFFYIDTDIEDVKVDVRAREATIFTILNQALSNTSLTYVVSDRYITIAPRLTGTMRQGIVIAGTVTDEKGEPMPGVNVVVKGTTSGIVTNVDGKYSLNVADRVLCWCSHLSAMYPRSMPLANKL